MVSVSAAIPKALNNLFTGMDITINNQPRHFSSSALTVQQLLDLELPEKQKGIAVAVNNSVIPKADWAGREIHEKDQVLIIKATQGG